MVWGMSTEFNPSQENIQSENTVITDLEKKITELEKRVKRLEEIIDEIYVLLRTLVL